MKRVLFVDDEPLVLLGLKNLLRVHCRSWEGVFVESAAAALQELERRSFDVVVSDLRMPGLDGAQLLTRVSERWPLAGRVVLSGYGEGAMLEQAARVAHQCLEKPCDFQALREAIEDCAPEEQPSREGQGA